MLRDVKTATESELGRCVIHGSGGGGGGVANAGVAVAAASAPGAGGEGGDAQSQTDWTQFRNLYSYMLNPSHCVTLTIIIHDGSKDIQ